MSHFSVLVIAKDSDSFQKLLAPYQENNMDNCPEQYLEFFDQEDKFRDEYESDSVEMIKTPTGELVYSWDNRFLENGFKGIASVGYAVPENYERLQVRHKNYYDTFEMFCKQWHGMERDAKTNRYGYWENPNKKWDWYEIGGRFVNALYLKDGTRATYAKIKDINPDNDMFSVWAMITPDGAWHEQGSMGFWGLSDATNESNTAFKKLLHTTLENVDPEFVAGIFDCHI